MPNPRIPIMYRRNPNLGWRHNNGRKVTDPRTGIRTYENFLVEDDYGVKSDIRGSGFDYDARKDFGQRGRG